MKDSSNESFISIRLPFSSLLFSESFPLLLCISASVHLFISRSTRLIAFVLWAEFPQILVMYCHLIYSYILISSHKSHWVRFCSVYWGIEYVLLLWSAQQHSHRLSHRLSCRANPWNERYGHWGTDSPHCRHCPLSLVSPLTSGHSSITSILLL